MKYKQVVIGFCPQDERGIEKMYFMGNLQIPYIYKRKYEVEKINHPNTHRPAKKVKVTIEEI